MKNISIDANISYRRNIMKNISLIFLLFSASLCFSTEITYKTEDIQKIHIYLDSLLYETDNLPFHKRKMIQYYISEIKNILISNQTANKKIYSEEEFKNIISQLKTNPQYNTQKIILKQVAKKSNFYMKQIKEIILTINFQNDKKDSLELLLPKAVDPENVGILFDIFWTQSDKEYINSILEKNEN